MASLEEATDLLARALANAGTGEIAARSVARALVLAEADGFKGHGLSRFASYAAQVTAGKVDGAAVPTASLIRPGLLLVDAAFGFAYPALDLAVERLPDMARTQGIACAAVRRSHHCGSAGLFCEALARQGLVALLFANTPAAIAPFGGSQPLFGTNPIAFACPLGDGEPVVVDMALSKVARGNIVTAAKRGEAIPDDWAFDAQGRATTDANAALEGTMAPLGGAKGVALALMVELLAGGLTGANYAGEASSFLDPHGGPPGTGQLLVVIDPAALGVSPERFATLAALVGEQDGARLPGARRLEARARAKREGIAVPADIAEAARA